MFKLTSIFNLLAAPVVWNKPILVYLTAWKSERITVVRNLLSPHLQFNRRKISSQGPSSTWTSAAGSGHLQLAHERHRLEASVSTCINPAFAINKITDRGYAGLRPAIFLIGTSLL